VPAAGQGADLHRKAGGQLPGPRNLPNPQYRKYSWGYAEIKYDRCVVQRYMHKPYLIDGLKFDMRIYVLVAGIDPLRIFVYEEGLARFATEEYRPPRSENLDNKFMHLTNYAINKESPNFIFN